MLYDFSSSKGGDGMLGKLNPDFQASSRKVSSTTLVKVLHKLPLATQRLYWNY